MKTVTVKLAERGARLRLQNEVCRIIIDKASPTFIFVTKPGIFEHEGVDSVYVPNEKIIVPLTDITRIEVETTRFTPDIKTFMEVAWDNDSPVDGTQSPEGDKDER